MGTRIRENSADHAISHSRVLKDSVNTGSITRAASRINTMRFVDEIDRNHDKYNDVRTMNNTREAGCSHTATIHDNIDGDTIADCNESTSREDRIAATIAASHTSGRDIEIPYIDYSKIIHFFQSKIFALLHRSVTTHETLTLGELVYSLMNAPRFSIVESQLVRALCQREVGDFLHEYAVEITSVRGDKMSDGYVCPIEKSSFDTKIACYVIVA